MSNVRNEMSILPHQQQLIPESVTLYTWLLFQQYFSYIVVVSFIDGGNRSKPPTFRKSLTSFITYCCIEYPWPWTWFKLTTLVDVRNEMSILPHQQQLIPESVTLYTWLLLGQSWSWLYWSWIYNYLYNQCLLPLKLWVWTTFMAKGKHSQD
jgi:hypothetical protein